MIRTLASLLLFAAAPASAEPPAAPSAIILDGDLAEWPANEWARADEHFVYLRLDFDTPRALFDARERFALLIDADDSDATGDPAAALEPGADLSIEFNPAPLSNAATVEGQFRRGERLRITPLFAPNAARAGNGTVSQSELQLLSIPNHAARSFELRLERSAKLADDLPAAGLLSTGKIRLALQRTDAATGAAIGAPLRTTLDVPPAKPFRAAGTVPAKAEGSVRVLSYNVLWSSPTKPEPGPAGFSRLLKKTDPDIVVLQEWFDREVDQARTVAQREEAVAAWFNQHVGGTWQVVGSAGQGVFVASRYKLLHRGPETLMTEAKSNWDFPIRLAAAVLDTPAGPITIGSVHLKCCGTLDSPEDVRRLAEVEVVNRSLRELASAATGGKIIVGGDYNLVGDHSIADNLIATLDTDGSPLSLATPLMLGDRIAHTHGGTTRNGSRSRLDYIAYPDAAFRVTGQFVIDTTILDAGSLQTQGLQAPDTEGSDHLPVVVDLKPTP